MSYKVPYLRGSMKDRDHVHWRMGAYADLSTDHIMNNFDNPLSPTSTPAAPYYPIGFTLAEMLKLSWLLKSFNVTGSFSFDAGVLTPLYSGIINPTAVVSMLGQGDPTAGLFDSFGSFASPPAITQENRMMDFANPKLLEFTGDGTYTPIDPPTYAAGKLLYSVQGNVGFRKRITLQETDTNHFGTAFAFCFLTDGQPEGTGSGRIPQNQVYYDAVNKLFYPLLFIGFQYTHAATSARVRVSTINNSLGTAGTLTLLGHSITLYLTIDDFGGVTPTASLTFDPKEYWPFLNSEGQPIYDTVTGAQVHPND